MNFFKKLNKILAKPAIRGIKIYQYTLSPDKWLPSFWLKGKICSHEPHCSKYSINVLKRYGFWPGIFYATDRVLHCTASMHKTYDPEHYRVVFFSSAPIGVPFLQHLADDKRFEVVWVVTQCDKPSGRWMEMNENIIKSEANKLFSSSSISNILLLDGFGWDGTSNRFPRLKSILESQWITVYTPIPKNTSAPILKEQLDDIIEHYADKINEKTIIIGHSLGCLLANHFITTTEKKIAKLISVAPAFRENNIDAIIKKFPAFAQAEEHLKNYQKHEFDTEKLEKLVSEHIVYLSDNDPFIPYNKAKKYYENNFDKVTIKTYQEKGHFNEKAWIKELPEILADIISIYTPTKLNPEKSEEGKAFTERLKEKKPDMLVVIAYGKIIPQAILDIPRIAPINVHGSILPKYRGASPIQSTLLNNDKETWITIMKMDATMDTWNMIDILRFTIPFQRTTKELIDEMKKIGPKFLNNTLRKYGKKLLGEVKQQEHKATYCGKIEKESWLIDPRKDSIETIYNKYRAFFLWPKIYFMMNDKRVIIEELKINEPLYNSNDELPLFQGKQLHPAVSDIQIKPEGKKTMPRKEFLNGYIK